MKLLDKLSKKHECMSAHPPATLGFLGDSVTNGIFEVYPCTDENGDFAVSDVCDQDKGYVACLRSLLHLLYPRAQLNIINAGVSGDKAPNAYTRLDRDLIPYHPDLTIVCFGLNDVTFGMEKLADYKNALLGITQRLLDDGSDVIMMTPPMPAVYRHPLVPEPFHDVAEMYSSLYKNGTVHAYMQAVRDVAAEKGVRLCDCFAKWERMYNSGVDTTKLLSNLLNHPVRELQPLIAHSLLDTIFD